MVKKVNSGKRVIKPKSSKNLDTSSIETTMENDSVKMEDFDGEKILEDIYNKFDDFDPKSFMNNELVNNSFNEIKQAEQVINSFNSGTIDEFVAVAEEQISKLNKVNEELSKSIEEINASKTISNESEYDKRLKNVILSNFWNGVNNNGWF